MAEQENVKLIQGLYAAFGRGDIPAILSEIANNAGVTHSPGSPDKLPWARTYRGRQGWEQFFKDLGEALEPLGFEPRDYVAQGDRVVAFGHFRARVKATGRIFEDPWAMDWVVRNGKVASCHVYEDTAAVEVAFRRG
jgi:hypothetical protein